ncbi:BatA domain-containing protein [Kiritimatiellaeota bacterium B1221]|nr:BatA domain-containing protein [Kiritimatiellaeota bacterium B1221]
MAFFNFYMLLGTFAVSIPIIIHILNRKSAKPVKWGAMRFLKDSLVSRRRKILLEEFLLMCLRCLLLLLLALVAARPFITPGSMMSWLVVLPMMLMATAAIAGSFVLATFPKWKRRLRVLAVLLMGLSGAALLFEERLQNKIFSARGARDIALILDASDSMDVQVDGVRNFDRAIAESTRLLETAPAGSTFSLIVGGGIPYAPIASPISDRDSVLTALQELSSGKGTMKVPETLTLAAMTLARGNNPAKQIILMSDGQREGWNLAGKRGEWVAVKESVNQLPGNPPVILRRFDLPLQIRNAAVSEVSFSRDSIGLDRPVGIYVTIKNPGDQAITPGEVLVKVEGEIYRNDTLGQLPPHAERVLIFEHQFTQAGAHLLEVELTGTDDLPADNHTRRIVIPVSKLKVLLVDGNPARQFMQRASAFAAMALAPRGDGEDSFIQPKVVSAADFSRLKNLSEYAAILLLDVPRLPKDAAENLARYVVTGGGLLVAHGPQTQVDFYNQWKLNAYPVLPAQLGDQQFPGLNADGGSDSELTFSPASLSHPALEMIRENHMDLAQVVFHSYWKLIPPEESGDLNSKVGFRLSNEDPFLISHPLGAGRVVQLSTGLDVRDSNLPSARAFVLVLHQLIYNLANAGRGDLNVAYTLGANLNLSNLVLMTDTDGRNQLIQPLKDTASAALLIDEAGKEVSASLQVMGDKGSRAQVLMLELPPMLSAGLYKIDLPESIRRPLQPWLNPDNQLLFSFYRSGNEGRLQALDEKDREKIRRYVLWQEALDAEQLVSAVEGARFGKELWRPIAVTLLLLLLVEIALCRWIAIRRQMGESLKVDFQELNQPKDSFLKHLDKFKNG